MQISLFLVGLAPLIIFAILDSLFSLKAGLLGAIVAIAFEIGLSLYFLGELDNLTLFNVALILVFTAIAWKFNKPEYFKLQPSIMSAVFGAVLLGSYLIGHPILSEMVFKYEDQLKKLIEGNPAQAEMFANGFFYNLLTETCFTLGILLFVHAALTAYTAYRRGNFAWLLARFSWYGFMFVAMIWARFRIGI